MFRRVNQRRILEDDEDYEKAPQILREYKALKKEFMEAKE